MSLGKSPLLYSLIDSYNIKKINLNCHFPQNEV